MFLNKNQESLLLEIAKQKGEKSIRTIGKKVYDTYMSSYNNMELLKLYGYVDLNRKKNRVVATLTSMGVVCIELILEKRRILNTIK